VVSTLITASPSLAAGYTPGTTYSITITVSGSGLKGFQFSPQSTAGAAMGTLIAPANLQIQLSKYITHRNASSGNPATWTFQWVAPPSGSGTVGFYAAAVGGRNVNLYRQTLTIPELTVTTASVTTQAASVITPYTAVSGGNVVSDGGSPVTVRGVAYGTAVNPTTSGPNTTSGTGTGSFVSNLTGLIPATFYHARAYATNSIGTAYGNEITFTTPTNSSISMIEPSMAFRCWPVPSSGKVLMDWNDALISPTSLDIVGMNGQVVRRFHAMILNSSHPTEINFEDLGVGFGVYQIRLLRQGKVMAQQRVIFNH
jgi:hypothetical protein